MTGRGKGGKGLGKGGAVTGHPVEVIPTGRIRREETEFVCQFSVPPRMQNYYYNPEPSDVGFESSRPVLFTSSEFQGGFNTKWKVMICLSRWEETTRWVSLYLCCTDGGIVHRNPSFKMLCEFRIVDRERRVLKSLKNTMVSVLHNEIRGLSKFIRFSDAVKMIVDNKLLVEAHLTLMYMSDMGDVQESKGSANLMDMDDFLKQFGPGDDELLYETASSSVSEDPEEDCNRGHFPLVDESDKVSFFVDGECVGWTDRNRLLEISGAYQICLQNSWEGSSTRLDFRKEDLACFTKPAIIEYIIYVDTGSTDVCQFGIGKYRELLELFEFANVMMTKSLMERCIVSMSERVKLRDVPHAVMFFREHRDLIDKESLDNFRVDCLENIHNIRESEGFQKLFEQERDYLTSFILDPDFSL